MKSFCSLLLTLFLTATNLLASNTPHSMANNLSIFAQDGNTPTSRSSDSYDGTAPAKTSKTKEAKQQKKVSWLKKTVLKKMMKKTNHHQKSNADAKSDWAGIVSISTGGLGLFLSLILTGFAIFLALAGITFGIISLVRIKKSEGSLKGAWMAIVGLIAGGLTLLLSLIVLVLVIALLA